MPKPKNDVVADFPGLVLIHQKIPSREVSRHEHAEHEFFLPLQGEIRIRVAERETKAGPGRMLYVPPHLDHSFSSSAQGSGERLIWLVTETLWRKHVPSAFDVTSLPANSLAKELLFHLLLRPKVEGAKYFIAALLESLGDSLAAAASVGSLEVRPGLLEGKVSDERVKAAIRLIERDAAGLAMSEIARASGLSERNFSRLFLREAGLTPKDYVIRCRIDKAKNLLAGSNLTVTEISLEVGYNSLSKFIEMFKAIEGLLPSDYRAEHAKI